MTGKPCKHCAGFCGDSGQTCEERYDAVWGPRTNKPHSQNVTEAWTVVDRLLSDAFSAGMNGDEFDMLDARKKFTAAMTEAKQQDRGDQSRALMLAADQLARLALECPHGSRIRYEACEWANIAHYAARAEAKQQGRTEPEVCPSCFWVNPKQQGPGEAVADAVAGFNAACDLFGIGSGARSASVLMGNLANVKRFAEYLHAVESEFFMVPGQPDDDYPDDEPEPECLVNSWGSTREQYVEQFRAALTRLYTAPQVEAKRQTGGDA